METYDWLMLILLVAATLFGAIKGFAWQLASIGSIAISYVAAYRFREPFSQMIKADPPWNRLFAMLLIYLGTSFLIWMVFRMVSRSIDRMKLKEFDRQVGALFGFAKGVLYCSLVTLFAVTLLGPVARQKIVGSRSGFYISKLLDRSRSVMPPEVSQVVRPYLDRFEQEMQNGGRGRGGFPWSASTVDEGLLPDSFWNANGGNGAGGGGGFGQLPQMPQGFDLRSLVPDGMR